MTAIHDSRHLIVYSEITSAIENLCHKKDGLLCFSDISSELEDVRASELAENISANQVKIQDAVSSRLELPEDVGVRVALVDSRMYVWTPQARKDELIEAYEDQFFYFRSNNEVLHIAETLQEQLGIDSNPSESLRHLNELLSRLNDAGDDNAARERPISKESPRLEGKVIRFYLDLTGKRLSDLEGTVVKFTGINGQAGIDNPRFPEGEELEVLKARLAAIIASDCHLRESGRIGYYEEHMERIEQVERTLRNFGDIELEAKHRTGDHEVYIPNQIGLMMIREGMTPGNKTINNPGLPPGFSDWSERAKRAYLEELIPEDGCFTQRGRFSWCRSHALYIDSLKEDYEIDAKIGCPEIDLILEKGHPSKGLIDQHVLYFANLQRIQNGEDLEKSAIARNLKEVVLTNRNRLIDDERRVAESLGIEIWLRPTGLKCFPRTGRVTVRWAAITRFREDAIRWARFCPPNDVVKRQKVGEWLRSIGENQSD